MGQDRLQMRIRVEGTRVWTRELLCSERLQTWQEVKPQEITKGKGHFALPMTIHILLLDLQGGAMPQDPFDHGGDFGRGTALELRRDTGRLLLHMPVDHDATAAIADVPLRHQVLVPGPELF